MLRALSMSLIVSVALVACKGGGDGDDSGQAASIDPQVKAEAEEIWKTRCVTCHGADGTGNGPGAAALDPKPRSFKDPVWQQQTTDERIQKVVVQGGAAVGLSPLMAPNPDLKDKPKVVKALVAKIRSFK